MSPASNRHGRLQIRIGSLLERDLGGEAISECSVDSPEGVKVADVAWCSPEFLARYGYETPYRSAPEICVEIRSPSHSEEEMRAKVALYLDQGAREVWMLLRNGDGAVFRSGGRQMISLVSRYPSRAKAVHTAKTPARSELIGASPLLLNRD